MDYGMMDIYVGIAESVSGTLYFLTLKNAYS